MACVCCHHPAQVLAIDERSASEGVILYVWDATDAKPVSARWVVLRLKETHPCCFPSLHTHPVCATSSVQGPCSDVQ